jgi:hypothetical protein
MKHPRDAAAKNRATRQQLKQQFSLPAGSKPSPEMAAIEKFHQFQDAVVGRRCYFGWSSLLFWFAGIATLVGRRCYECFRRFAIFLGNLCYNSFCGLLQ